MDPVAGRKVQVVISVGGKLYPAPTLSAIQVGKAIRLTAGHPADFSFPAEMPVRDVVTALLAKIGQAGGLESWSATDNTGRELDPRARIGDLSPAVEKQFHLVLKPIQTDLAPI